MAKRQPQPADDDETRPAIFSLVEWREIMRQFNLTGRKAQITGLIIQGLRNDEIAAELSKKRKITTNTVRDHIVEITRRIGAESRRHITYRVVEMFRDRFCPLVHPQE